MNTKQCLVMIASLCVLLLVSCSNDGKLCCIVPAKGNAKLDSFDNIAEEYDRSFKFVLDEHGKLFVDGTPTNLSKVRELVGVDAAFYNNGEPRRLPAIRLRTSPRVPIKLVLPTIASIRHCRAQFYIDIVVAESVINYEYCAPKRRRITRPDEETWIEISVVDSHTVRVATFGHPNNQELDVVASKIKVGEIYSINDLCSGLYGLDNIRMIISIPAMIDFENGIIGVLRLRSRVSSTWDIVELFSSQ